VFAINDSDSCTGMKTFMGSFVENTGDPNPNLTFDIITFTA